METTSKTVTEFIEKHGIKFECHSVYTRPDGLMSDSPMYHYRCRILHGRKGFGLYFSQGTGIDHEPTAADVLNCLADDASSYDNVKDFDDWCNEMGFDTDSRKAEKIFRACKRQAEQLKRTLGEEAYAELLYDVERL